MKATYFKKLLLPILLMISLCLYSCTSQLSAGKEVGARKFINNFDYDTPNYRPSTLLINKLEGTSAKISFDSNFKHQGERSLKCDFHFSDNQQLDKPEIIRLQRLWGNYRSDLSFYPIGISFWIHSDGSNNRFTVTLLQQNDSFTLKNDQLYTYTFSDDNLLQQEGWQEVVIPYEKFIPGGENPGGELNLARVNGYRFEIENVSGIAHNGVVYIDALEQLTSYNPEINEPARFTSIFIQLHPSRHLDYDWSSLFDSYLEVGIDTIIIQRSALASKEDDSALFYYNTDKFSWKSEGYNIIDKMFIEAEKSGMKLILGVHSGRYPVDKGDAAAYEKLLDKNKVVIDDLYDKFGNSKAMAGWYICEEFHDGSYRGWWKDEDRALLAHYQQRVAAYAKSKPNKYLVAIAPALWRGRPADMTYHFFKTFFEQAPDIDILYLQDCGGRCRVDEGDFDVVLPHWYSYIKQACDETGVQFGVDIESFKRCKTENIKWHPKIWSNLKDQLIYANLFTKNISQFSWHSFRPGFGAFEEYREYLKEHGMLRKKVEK